MINKIIDKIKDKNILILGFGKEGKTTYNFIRKYLKEQKLTILDENQIDKIDDNNLDIIIDKVNDDTLSGYDLIFKSPGISLKHVDTDKLNITSQLEMLLEVNKNNVIAITGTKGKSTTTSLLYEVIKNQKENTFLLGNIGIPIFDMIENFDDESTLVIETSSHQLEYIKESPHISVLLNLHPEHLDHYKNLDGYYNAKLNIFKYQSELDYCLFDTSVKDYIKNNKPTCIEVNDDIYINNGYVVLKDNTKLYDVNSKRNLLGDHNLNNIMFVLMISNILGLDNEKAVETINEFKPLEHRMEYVGKYDDINYYNDSIATIPDSTMNCIKALKEVDTLIVGGKDRGLDYSELIEFINNSNINNIICLPKTGHDMIDRINKNKYKVENLEEAVEIAKKVTQKNKMCVLSPAASSYGFFKNFEERGNLYKELVRRK